MSSPTEPYAKIIADSISPDGTRLTTFEVRFHRFVLAEWNTHRVFSRNSASSRAIPLAKQIAKVRTAPAEPLVWPREQKGMQGGDEIAGEWLDLAREEWLEAASNAAHHAKVLGAAGVHKSVANRLLEPFMMHTCVVTMTALENFFEQRAHHAAQPEIRVPAEMMLEAYRSSTPDFCPEGEFHLPYVQDDPHACEWAAANTPTDEGLWSYQRMLAQISAARCAGVSYETQGSEGRDPERDALVVYPRLAVRDFGNTDPIHWSPLEHVATPWAENRQSGLLTFPNGDGTRTVVETGHLPSVGNLLGWRSLRTTVEAERGAKTYV